MASFLRVVINGSETSLTVDSVVSVNGIPYNQNSAPSESEMCNRIVVLETAYAAIAHDLKLLMELALEDEVPNPDTPPTEEGP